jgi:hypothetical protein
MLEKLRLYTAPGWARQAGLAPAGLAPAFVSGRAACNLKSDE